MLDKLFNCSLRRLQAMLGACNSFKRCALEMFGLATQRRTGRHFTGGGKIWQ